MPRIVACGTRRAAYDQFAHALAARSTDEALYLLVDSEGPVTSAEPWAHVAMRKSDGWSMPPGAHDEDLHLMVQVMETWFLADRAALQRVFGKDFRTSALPNRDDIESVPKEEVLRALHEASKGAKAGRYGKGQHSFRILAELDPAKLERASPWARRLLDVLRVRRIEEGLRLDTERG